MLTENDALYKASLLLSDEQNNKVNKLNFYCELGLTVVIFLSGILILTLEKDWWGGYLGPDKNYTNSAANF